MDQTSLLDTERFVPVEDGFRIWTRSIGGGAPDERPPILMMHGGPGGSHDYMVNLSVLASPTQRVVFYDQLGSGRSDCPDDLGLWQLPRFVAEIDHVRNALGLDRVVLLGQSWGGMLAIEYATTQPAGLIGLILANSTASSPLWSAEAQRLRAALPPDVQATLTKHEIAGTTDDSDYQAAVGVFFSRHVIRVQPLPDFVKRSFDHIGPAYGVMWGPSEFYCTGNLKDWDRTASLGDIHVPTLLISGEHDESTPVINKELQGLIAGARWVLLDGCSHLTHVEAPERFLRAVRDFLESI